MTQNGQSPGERGLFGDKLKIVDIDEMSVEKGCLSASEAIFGFCAWLTCRKIVTSMGGAEDCAPVVELIKTFCETNDLADPRDGWEENLTHPKVLEGEDNDDG